SPVHVARLANLVKDLVACHPHKVRVHKLDNWLVSTSHRQPPCETGKGVFRNRRTKNTVRILAFQPFRRTIRATAKLMNIFAHDNDTWIINHPVVEGGCDRVVKPLVLCAFLRQLLAALNNRPDGVIATNMFIYRLSTRPQAWDDTFPATV